MTRSESGPVAGWPQASQDANRNALTPEETAPLLAAYRAGDISARDKLIRGHQYILVSFIRNPSHPETTAEGWHESLAGELQMAMTRIITNTDNKQACAVVQCQRRTT